MHALSCFTVHITTPIPSFMMTSSHTLITSTPVTAGKDKNPVNYVIDVDSHINSLV